MKQQVLIYMCFFVLLTACSGVPGPAQIAVAPKEAPIAAYPRSLDSAVVYNATLDMEVSDVEIAAERAKQIAFEQHGYLVSAQSWYRDGEKHTTLVLAVPAYRFNPARDDLLRLGKLSGEWISSELVSFDERTPDIDSQITLYLHPKESVFGEVSLPQWRPVRTLEKAWSVFVSIFGFLLDILIWIIVVLGPFVLIGWGIYKLSRRVWQKTKTGGSSGQ